MRWAVLVLAAAVTGLAATKPIVAAMVERSAIANGPWRTSIGTGSANANIYERAAVAVAGLYALAKEETVYYTAFTDDEGHALDGKCDYELEGAPLPARWWSLTIYGADNYLVANPANVYSRHASNMQPQADGSYVVEVSAHEQPRNWLPAPEVGEFSVTLRLYNPEAAVYDKLATVALPRIARSTCR